MQHNIEKGVLIITVEDEDDFFSNSFEKMCALEKEVGKSLKGCPILVTDGGEWSVVSFKRNYVSFVYAGEIKAIAKAVAQKQSERGLDVIGT